MNERERAALRALKRSVRGVRPDPRIYWADMLGSATIGWSAIAAATWLHPALAIPAIVIAALALWRAAYFVHEIVHFAPSQMRGFVIAWNLLVGLPCGLPSVMARSHVDHHRARRYGTAQDPEYEPVARWRRWQLVLSTLSGVLVPPLLWLRWAVLAPLGWLCPPLRRLLLRRASSLVTNAGYLRPPERGDAAPRFMIQELGAALAAWAWLFAVTLGPLPARAPLVTWAALALALVLNQARTLVAHDYESTGEPMSRERQVADSVTVVPSWLSAPMLPVGTGYHALHHLLPALPYHALPAAHQRLMASLPEGASYRATVRRSLFHALRECWSRAAVQPSSQDRNTLGSRPRGSSGPSMQGTQ